MKDIKTIIFDFDGVIADTLPAVRDIWNELGPKYGYGEVTADAFSLIRTRGVDVYLKRLGVSRETLIKMVPDLRSAMSSRLTQLEIFQRMRETIEKLDEHFSLVILSSNSKLSVKKFLARKEIFKFGHIYQDNSFFSKELAIEEIVRARELKLQEVVYVGDEVRDVKSAQEAGVRIVAVTWGYNSRELLEKCKPNFLVDTPQELPTLFSNGNF